MCSIEAANLAIALVERTPLVRRRLVFGGELTDHEPLEEAIARHPLHRLDAPEGQAILGGIKISPRELEALLEVQPTVLDVAVVSAPDDYWGETFFASVLLVDPRDASAELAAELLDLCRERIAGFTRPTWVSFVDKLPREGGRPLRHRAMDEVLARWVRYGV